ncbi:hypothetical protein DFH08DRAFT_774177 [Mycena albidolilacea]|uniref:F-box domain-containing protein n=1 Tax=Mycena albidolilacea TaxID=1033008 RepID=A0AAD7EWK7_9AGAR|nr:hypothetical protein DFH08DRAFT_774177 [Mycena albidolilacea]
MTQSAADAASGRAVRAADRAHLANVETQILELERSLSSLKEEKEAIRDRLAIYTYPVLTLPNEIVSQIFVHFLPAFPHYPPPIGLLSPYLLCQICQKWRDIALATPALWSVISLSFHKAGRVPQKLHYLQTSIERSGSCRLSLKLATRLDDSYLAELVHMVIDHFRRVEYLDLSHWPAFGFPTDAELSLPFLRGLKLGDYFNAPVTRIMAPVLQQVVLQDFGGLDNSFFPWSQLTAITVEWIRLDGYSYLINQLVNVVYCNLGLCATDQLSLQDVTLSHLETFILRIFLGNHLPPGSGIMATLTLPALRRLQITETLLAGEDDPVNSIASLVTRSGCNLRELSIPDASTAHERYRDTFPSTSITSEALDSDIIVPFLMEWEDEDEESSDSDDEFDADSED